MRLDGIFDPFGTALRLQGLRLQNETQSITNATKLMQLATQREMLNVMMEDAAESRRGSESVGGSVSRPDALRKQGEGGNSTDTPFMTGTSDPSGSSLQLLGKEYQDLRKNADRYRKLGAFSPQYAARAEQYDAKAADVIKEIVKVKGEEAKRNDKFFDALRDTAAAAVDSPEAQGRALALLSQRFPNVNMDSLYKQLGMQMGPNGQPIWNKQAWEQVGQGSGIIKDRLQRQRQAFLDEMALRTREQRDTTNRIAQQRADQEAARNREAAGERAGRDSDRKEARQEKLANDNLKMAQHDLDKDPLEKNYDRYRQARGMANALAEKLSRGEPIQAADVQALRSHFNNIKEDFRSRAGGKYQEKDFEHLNGVIQNLDKWATSIGRATPAVSRSAAITAINALEDEYTIRTSNLAMKELKAAQNLKRKGGDASLLNLNADIPYLIRKGQASFGVDAEGNQKIRIKTPEGEKVFDFPEGAY